MAPRLIEVVGSLNIDLISVTDRVPGPGETIACKSSSTGFGGKGANQAVAAARLSKPNPDGPSVRMIGAVGKDQFGQDFLRHLDNEGIDRSAVAVKEGKNTGTATIIVETSGQNRILFSEGANGLVKPADMKLSSEDSIVVFQHEIPQHSVKQGLIMAIDAGKETILNPAPAFHLPDGAYKGLAHLILNESEAAYLAGVAEQDLMSSLETVADFFLSRGVKNVIITLGSQGVYYQNASAKGTIAARKVKVVDTTAAGDTFVGGYAVYIAEHGSDDIKPAIEFANRAASMAVQKEGAQSAVPYLKDVPTA
ncbi:hypothetical protein FH972_024620 [Carpinus fangiana]|uniref:Ribokinase n=1 Tax=Carpinus fangiana TaxID=176857 RepID=A0A5N6KZF6_9ROSI|nr:hypothetical protein FH972_024620 [Carpinus fangiana]